jgi:hypothetical protein
MSAGTGRTVLPTPFTSTRKYAQAVALFLEDHAWLFRHHVVDFITEDHWQHMQPAWCESLLGCSTSELLNLPVGRCPDRAYGDGEGGGWPPGLVEFIRGAAALALPRVPDEEPGGETKRWKLSATADASPLSKALSRGMKAKKRHEVERLGALVAGLCNRLGCRTVVDFGAGQGYLSQLLHFGYGLQVVGIDSSEHQSHGAERRNKRVRKAVSKAMKRRPVSAAAPLPAVSARIPATNPDVPPVARAPAAPAACAVCGASAKREPGAAERPLFKWCSLCNAVCYCSKLCQKKGGKQHQASCTGLQQKREAAAERAKVAAQQQASAASGITSGGGVSLPQGAHTEPLGIVAVTCRLDQRLQTLSAVLGGAVASCPPPSGGIDYQGGGGGVEVDGGQPCAGGGGIDYQGGGAFVLLGLHTCGDLTPSMLRVFSDRAAWGTGAAAAAAGGGGNAQEAVLEGGAKGGSGERGVSLLRGAC